MIHFINNNPQLIEGWGCKTATIDDLLDWSNGKTVIAIDTETEGLFDFDNDVIMLQIGDAHDQFVIDCRNVSVAKLQPLLENPDVLKVFWNAKFDMNFLRFSFGFKLNNIHDCFLMECLLNAGNEDAQLGLGAASVKYLNKTLNKAVRNKFVGLSGTPYTETQIVYGAEDVEVLLKIKDIQDKELVAKQLLNVARLENLAVCVLADIEYNGMAIDISKWISVADNTRVLVDEYTRKLDTLVLSDPRLSRFVPEYVQGNLFGFEERRVQINWASPKQKTEVLQHLGIAVENSDIRELLRHRHEPLVALLIEYSKYAKLATAFGKDFLKYINPNTNRIHQSLWQILSTGRISSSEPNITQIPSKGELGVLIRSAFVPQSGYKFVGGDFASMELRIIADQSGDPLWIEAYENHEDLHSKLAALTFNIPITDVKKPTPFKNTMTYRDVQKTINFGLAYGMSEFKLSKTIDVDIDTARSIIDSFFEKVPTVKAYLERQGKRGVYNLYSTTPAPFHRKRFYNDPGLDFKAIGAIERASKNAPIQGANADITKTALIFIRNYINDHNLDIKIVNVIHDEIITECREDIAEWWSGEMSKLMIAAAKVVIKTIPVVVDCKVSDCWTK